MSDKSERIQTKIVHGIEFCVDPKMEEPRAKLDWILRGRATQNDALRNSKSRSLNRYGFSFL